MAMSQGERIARLQEQSNQYVSRRQTKDCSLQTYIVQARASGTLQPRERTPTNYAIENKVVAQGSQVPLTRDTAIGKNVYSADGAPLGCCATVVASGTETFAGTQAVTLAAQKCAVCSDPDYSLSNGYATRLNTVCCPLPNLPNTAKTTEAEKCASCLKFYFPNPAQGKCYHCETPYPSSALYPPQPIDWEFGKYGDAGVPTPGPRPTQRVVPAPPTPSGPTVITDCVTYNGMPQCLDIYGYWNSALLEFTAPNTSTYYFTLGGAAIQAHTTYITTSCQDANTIIINNYNNGNPISLNSGDTIYIYVSCGSNNSYSINLCDL